MTTTTISRRQFESTKKRIEAGPGLADRVEVLSKTTAISGDLRQARLGGDDRGRGIRVLRHLFPGLLGAVEGRWHAALAGDRDPRSVSTATGGRSISSSPTSFRAVVCPSIGAICRSLGRRTDFQVFHLEDITPHYAETLAIWRQRFRENLAQVRKLGFSEEFLRTWEFYFCYCEGEFRERVIGDVQILLTKPECRRAAIVPPLDSSFRLRGQK